MSDQMRDYQSSDASDQRDDCSSDAHAIAEQAHRDFWYGKERDMRARRWHRQAAGSQLGWHRR
jgi:hypothetical protein